MLPLYNNRTCIKLLFLLSVSWMVCRIEGLICSNNNVFGNNLREVGVRAEGMIGMTRLSTTSIRTRTQLFMIRKLNREDEIRRKIMELKRDGRIGKNQNEDDVENTYEDKIKSKLGGSKKTVAASRMMGRAITGVSSVDVGSSTSSKRSGNKEEEAEEEEDDVVDMKEKDLLDLVSAKLEEKMKRSSGISIERASSTTSSSSVNNTLQENNVTTASSTSKKKTEDSYRPSRGSWGFFERPKDISKAYGGGKRVGVGGQVDEKSRIQAEEETKERLQRYREKAGIDVVSEKENAVEIEEAIKLASLANQRGMYATTVSCLEKVTRYCSSNSRVGGTVFLELAMAYEAVGRTSEAVQVYSELSKSPIERIKINAKKLLYGLEAMNFMRNEVKDAAFSRDKIRDNFIDTTGFANIAANFDDVYNTAYVDLDKGSNYYKRLTESLVRSSREARQILLKALNSGDVPRLKIVQALRSISNSFDGALVEEMKLLKPEDELESSAFINGVPIRKTRPVDDPITSFSASSSTLDKYNLATSSQMLMNLNGEWRLQLIADQKGDGVKFFNTTLSWQSFDTTDIIDDNNNDDDDVDYTKSNMQYSFYGPSGFSTLSKEGSISFIKEKRIISRIDNLSSSTSPSSTQSNQQSPISILANALFTPSNKKLETKQTLQPQQIVLVDSVLCVTRLVPEKVKKDNNIRNYFSVWRRVPTGTYTDSTTSIPSSMK